MNTALEYSTRVVQEGGRRCKKSTLNDLVHLTPLRIPLMNPPYVKCSYTVYVHGFNYCSLKCMGVLVKYISTYLFKLNFCLN
jgi:hypothetical protein